MYIHAMYNSNNIENISKNASGRRRRRRQFSLKSETHYVSGVRVWRRYLCYTALASITVI